MTRQHGKSRNARPPRTSRTGSVGSSTSSRRSTARATSLVSTVPSRHQGHDQGPPAEQSNCRTSYSVIQEGDLAVEHNDVCDDTLNEIIMAVDMTPRGTIGCCYYIAREEKLYFMEDIQIGDVDIVSTRVFGPNEYKQLFVNTILVRTSVEPTVVLLSAKVDDAVIDSFDPGMNGSESASGDNDPFRLPFLLENRPPSEFYYEAAKSKLMTLNLGEDSGPQVRFCVPGDHLNGLEEDRVHGSQGLLLRLAGMVDMESRVTVCIGKLHT